jgi:CRISPR/Cas system-associated exonuclease Cas4 (RecB family)
MPNTHHPCSPSALFRRCACPGSMHMENKVIEALGRYAPVSDTEDGEWSEEGTLLHEAVFTPKLRENLSNEQLLALEPIDEFLEQFKDEQQTFHELHLQLIAPFLIDPKFVWTEGTADFVCIRGNVAYVADWKFGFIEVDSPEENHQLAAYAAMVMQEFGVDEVVVYVLQPRISKKPKEFTFTNFAGLLRTIKQIVINCQRPNAPLNNGSHCRYCNAKSFCPEYAKLNSIVSYTRETLAIDELAEVWAKTGLVLARINEIRTHIKNALALNGGEAPGILLYKKKGSRVVADVQKCYESVQEFFTIEEFMAFVKVNISDFEKELGKRMKAKGKVKSIKQGIDAFRKMEFIETSGESSVVKLIK